MKKILWIILLTILIGASVSEGQVHKVPADYSTIALAIANSLPGDTIKISAGTYAEQMVISHNLTLIGAGKTETLIREIFPSPDSTVLKVNYSTVLIRDIQFSMVTNDDGCRRGLVSVNSDVTVKQCAFVTPHNVGIASVNGSLTVDSVWITSVNSGNNSIAVDSAAANQTAYMGCDLGISINNSIFSIKHFTGGANIDHIIDVSPSSGPSVLNITYPLDASQSVHGTIENSTFYAERDGSYGQAIRIYGSFTRPDPQLIIRNNRFRGQAPDSTHAMPNGFNVAAIGFSGTGGYAEIYGNDIQYFNNGISLYGYATADIHDNLIINNARNGIITSWGGGSYSGFVDLGGGVYNSPGRNSIYNNGQYNVKNLNSRDVSALYNNWGTVDNAAIAATMYDHTKFTSLGTVHYDLTGLPVELISFSASASGSAVELNWETATEVNNYGFNIERRDAADLEPPASGAAGWIKIGFVQGHGNSNSPKYYSFTDRNPACTKQEYRLKQIDTDGKFQYSNAAEIEIAVPVSYSLSQNYPNPFNPATTIKYSIPAETGYIPSLQHVTLKVYDLLGRETAALVDEYKAAGSYEVKFDAFKLASGIYLYKLQSGTFIQTKKMILMK